LADPAIAPDAFLVVDSPGAWLVFEPSSGLSAVPKSLDLLFKHNKGFAVQDQELSWGEAARFDIARAFRQVCIAHALRSNYCQHLYADPILGPMLLAHQSASEASELGAAAAQASKSDPRRRI
jgi:hypothetical protein